MPADSYEAYLPPPVLIPPVKVPVVEPLPVLPDNAPEEKSLIPAASVEQPSVVPVLPPAIMKQEEEEIKMNVAPRAEPVALLGPSNELPEPELNIIVPEEEEKKESALSEEEKTMLHIKREFEEMKRPPDLQRAHRDERYVKHIKDDIAGESKLTPTRLLKLVINEPFKSPSVVKTVLAGQRVTRADLVLFSAAKFSLVPLLPDSSAAEAFAESVTEVSSLDPAKFSSAPREPPKSLIVVSKSQGPTLLLGCGCRVRKEDVQTTVQQLSRRVQTWQIRCIGKKRCGYILTEQEILQAVGVDAYRKARARGSDNTEPRCVLCGRSAGIERFHRDHALCKDCWDIHAKYYHYTKHSEKKGGTVPCPVRGCPRWIPGH